MSFFFLLYSFFKYMSWLDCYHSGIQNNGLLNETGGRNVYHNNDNEAHLSLFVHRYWCNVHPANNEHTKNSSLQRMQSNPLSILVLDIILQYSQQRLTSNERKGLI